MLSEKEQQQNCHYMIVRNCLPFASQEGYTTHPHPLNNNYLSTKSEVFKGKSQTKTLRYLPRPQSPTRMRF